MSAEFLVEKPGVHRRGLGAGVRRLNKRWIFTPTAIFTTDTDSIPTTTSQAVADPNATTTTSVNAPTTTATTDLNPIPILTTTSPTTVVTATSAPATSTTPAVPTTTSTPSLLLLPTTTQQQQQQQPTVIQENTQVQPTVTRTIADALTEVTQTLTSTRPGNAAAASSAQPSPSASTTPTGTSTGLVVGGIIAAVVGVAGILFAVVYFIRRSRKTDDGDDGNDFNAQAFRRQSVVLQDDGLPAMSRAMTVNRGGNTPRPPTMIERKMANTPAPYDTPAMSHPYGYAGAYGQPSFAPGQIMTPGPYTPTTVNSAHPFFSPYGESPIGSPVSVAPYDSAYTEDGHMISRQPSNGSSAILSRQPSSAALPSTPQPTDAAQYVDLNRSSVTPFQAAQYAEISRRLNTTPPQPLPTFEVAEVEEEHGDHNGTAPVYSPRPVSPLELQPSLSFDEPQRFAVQPTPRESSFPESPFADPTMSFHEEQAQHALERDSFPMPPSPTYSSTSRVTSKPPTLPEIHIQQRPFSPVSLDFPLVPSTPRAVPSPLASTFSMPSPPADAHFPESPMSATSAAPVSRGQARPASKRPDTVYTLYDEEDAYAGI